LNGVLQGMAQNEVVVALNEELLTERIVRATSRVCFIAPGLYDWVAEALLEVGQRIGWDSVDVVVDPDPYVVQVGYGTEEALKRLCASGACVRKADHLRLGLVITDDRAAIFTPIPLNIEEFPKNATSPNAVELSVTEANRIIDAVAPKPTPIDAGRKPVAEIGQDEVAKTDLQILEKALKDAPPVAPDLARQMWVLNSQIQIVKITFDGARLSQHRISLRAEQLGIEDADLVRRISGSFKLFEADIDGLLAPLRDDLERIKEVYGLKPIGDLGLPVLGKDRKKLENALSMFKNNLERAQAEMEEALTEELDNSRKRLKKMLAAKVQEPGMSEASLERRLNYIIGSMKFPFADKVLSRIEFDWSLLNITSQMIAKESFAQKIRDLYGKSIEELATVEQAVGVKSQGKTN
jgi:hypothetical protein